MRKCKAFECERTGKNICCKDCEQLQTCQDACEDALNQTGTCPDEVEEETAVQLFQTKEVAVIRAMADMLRQKKELEAREKEVRAKLVEAMDAYGVKSFENDLLKVTHIAATSKTTVDSKRLKKEQPEVYAEYSKTSTVAASVRIALK